MVAVGIPNEVDLMRVQHIAIVAAFLMSVSASAALASEPVVAKLQTPVAKPMSVVAASAVFKCAADTCTGGGDYSSTASTAGCRELVVKVGAVTSYGTQTKPLPSEKLAACNTSAKTR